MCTSVCCFSFFGGYAASVLHAIVQHEHVLFGWVWGENFSFLREGVGTAKPMRSNELGVVNFYAAGSGRWVIVFISGPTGRAE